MLGERATAIVSKRLCEKHFATPPEPGLVTRLRYIEKPSKAGFLGPESPGVAVSWGGELQLGSGADSGESSHMALMKSTTSLPPPPLGPSRLQLMQCPV